jgi:hypothetical protein
MAVEIITSFDQLCNSAGDPLSGAKIYVYNVGTTTLRDVFSDTALTPPAAANPIICDSAGRHDMRYIATGSYKILVTTSAGSTIYTRDNIDGRVPVGSGTLAIANGASFWIRWTDFNANGSDDGLAIDDFSLTPNFGAALPTRDERMAKMADANTRAAYINASTARIVAHTRRVVASATDESEDVQW